MPNPCVIFTPVASTIDLPVDDALKERERRGYPVYRVRGCSAIDQGRNKLATDTMKQGFDKTPWIDSDVLFKPNDVEKIRSHNMPLCCGIFPKKGRPSPAVLSPMPSCRIRSLSSQLEGFDASCNYHTVPSHTARLASSMLQQRAKQLQ